MDTANNYLPSPGENSHAIQPTKEDLGRYIHDIADLEKRIFTIDKTIQDSRNQFNRTKKEIKDQAQSAKETFERAETALNNAKAMKQEAFEEGVKDNNSYGLKKPVKKVVVEDTRFFGKRLTAAIVDFFIVIIGFMIWAENMNHIVLLGSIALALFLLLVGAIKDKKRRRRYKKHEYSKQCEQAEKDYQKAMEEYESAVQNIVREAEEEFAQATREVLNIKAKLDAMDSWEKKLNEEIDKVAPQREMLTNQMHKLYSFNLIPPDYREVDCTMMFDQIFRNGLADNMREAVKIYEERVFRGDVIRGIDKIYGMLGQLNAGMMQIGRNLESVKELVSFMSNDLCSLVSLTAESVDNQIAIRDEQRVIRRETELSRYALESVRSSTASLEYYAWNWR